MNLDKIREIHNSIKNDIINDAYSHIPYTLNVLPTSILDIACGRGGDMHKFYHANFKRVICVDNHIPSLEIAKKRYTDCYNNKSFRIEFISHDLKLSVLNIQEPVDVIVMNFALNYFFESENTLKMLLKTVSTCLKDGGYFIGIALDGDRVKKSPRNDEIYTVVPENTFNENGPYNCAYRFLFNHKNENNDYFAFRGDMIEYLISLDELDSVAKTFDLERVYHTYLDTDVPVLKMDVVFKYIYKTHTKMISSSCKKRFFPSKVSNLNLKIMPDTSSLCSRPEASSLLVNVIKNLNIDVKNLVDATAHVGSDTIALALYFQNCQIISIEIQEETAQALRHNISECRLDNVRVIHDDCLNVLGNEELFVDVLYIDAPWGGVDYKKKNTLSLRLSDIELSEVIKTYCKRVKFIVLKVPKNFDMEHFKISLNNYNIQTFDYKYNNVIKFRFIVTSV